jgi:nucleoside 2-deoxyribosyltransferase
MDNLQTEIARAAQLIQDADGLFIENFGLPLNLMLGISCNIVEGELENRHPLVPIL